MGSYSSETTAHQRTSHLEGYIGSQADDLHQRDVELILRVLALSKGWEKYERPLKDFLNGYMEKFRNDTKGLDEFAGRFRAACDLVQAQLGSKPFHLRGPLNAAVLDSVLGTIVRSPKDFRQDLAVRFSTLIGDPEYERAVERATADITAVKIRFEKGLEYLAP